MPSKPMKPCSYPRCPNLTEGAYCEQHTRVKVEAKAESDKEYDKKKRDLRSTAFYKSKAWKELREYVYRKQYGLCQRCLKRNEFVRGDIVHHIIEIKDDWDKRLDEDNLEVLCHKCHNRIHNQKKRKTH
ncbi:HNH endonuclease [Bacillus methanolicus]|uniref:HNH endonuclease n=1 Tax=Bacillus methanolicus TaxID=1471 RepID=UPI0023807C71|nr:HNH endonuclease signature motif containing protein [Bacillus methanolicus]MDE3838650.1 HNH endonuclease [Bacillus methanolicus]